MNMLNKCFGETNAQVIVFNWQIIGNTTACPCTIETEGLVVKPALLG